MAFLICIGSITIPRKNRRENRKNLKKAYKVTNLLFGSLIPFSGPFLHIWCKIEQFSQIHEIGYILCPFFILYFVPRHSHSFNDYIPLVMNNIITRNKTQFKLSRNYYKLKIEAHGNQNCKATRFQFCVFQELPVLLLLTSFPSPSAVQIFAAICL